MSARPVAVTRKKDQPSAEWLEERAPWAAGRAETPPWRRIGRPRRPRAVAEHPAAARLGGRRRPGAKDRDGRGHRLPPFDAGPDAAEAAQAIVHGTTRTLGKAIGGLTRRRNTP